MASTTGNARITSENEEPCWVLRTETLVVAFGRVQWAKAGSYSLIRTRTANLRVYWAGKTMPPEVYVGHTVCFAGKIKTYDGGRLVLVVDAVPLTDGQKAMQRFTSLVRKTSADPTSWAPHLLDGFRRRK